jgi:hypothetical protein
VDGTAADKPVWVYPWNSPKAGNLQGIKDGFVLWFPLFFLKSNPSIIVQEAELPPECYSAALIPVVHVFYCVPVKEDT